MSEFAEKKALRSQIAAAKKAGKSVQTIGRLQYKLNQLMKNPQKGKPVKRKTPLTGSPSAGTAKKKAPDMYNEAVALDKKKKTVTITGLNGKKKTVASGSGKLIDVKSEGSIKTKTGSARGGDRFGPNAAKNKRIAELERLLEEEKKILRIRTSAR